MKETKAGWVQTNFNMPPELWTAVKMRAFQEHTTLGGLIRRLLSEHVDRAQKAQ
jgi:hypothetical protein